VYITSRTTTCRRHAVALRLLPARLRQRPPRSRERVRRAICVGCASEETQLLLEWSTWIPWWLVPSHPLLGLQPGHRTPTERRGREYSECVGIHKARQIISFRNAKGKHTMVRGIQQSFAHYTSSSHTSRRQGEGLASTGARFRINSCPTDFFKVGCSHANGH
jgi:hypothetical protein